MIRKLSLALAAVVPLLVLAAPKPADKAAPAKAAPDAEASGELTLPAAPLEGGAKAVEAARPRPPRPTRTPSVPATRSGTSPAAS
jgi:hypothetical protein